MTTSSSSSSSSSGSSQGNNNTSDDDIEWTTTLPFLDLKEDELSYMDNMMYHHHSHDQQQQDEKRFLKGPPLQPAAKTLPDDTFAFDFAIDGKITTWNKKEFLDQKIDVQRVVEAFVLLDDPNYIPKSSNGGQSTVELAIRMRGCGRLCTFGVTHLYWA
jgi:hypothetical protein